MAPVNGSTWPPVVFKLGSNLASIRDKIHTALTDRYPLGLWFLLICWISSSICLRRVTAWSYFLSNPWSLVKTWDLFFISPTLSGRGQQWDSANLPERRATLRQAFFAKGFLLLGMCQHFLEKKRPQELFKTARSFMNFQEVNWVFKHSKRWFFLKLRTC